MTGNILTTVVIVVETIFKNLNARQLNTCSRVCKVWYDQAKREKECRKKLRWNYFTFDHETDDANKNWWQSVSSYILGSPVEPRSIVVFCSETLWDNLLEPKPTTRKRQKTSSVGTELFLPILPADCVFQVVITEGIIGTDANMKTEEFEEFDMVLSLLIFGDYPGLEIVPFSSTHQECLALANYWSGVSTQVPSCMENLLNKEVKMLNLYCPMSGIDQEICYSMYRMFRWPLIAGGYVNGKLVRDQNGACHSSMLNSMVTGLALCGSDVQVASVLIRSETDTEEEVEKNIESLVKLDLPLQHSFAFMYACVGRGIHVYDKHNVESSIFRKYFPNTPLLGFFGNGEIGCVYPSPDGPQAGCQQKSGRGGLEDGQGRDRGDHLKKQMSDLKQQEELKKMKHPPKLLHAYTTVMCLVSLP